MTRLIVTTNSSFAGAIQHEGLADVAIAIERRLVGGQLPDAAARDAFFAPRTTQPHGLHWLDDTPLWRRDEWGVRDRGLIAWLSECRSVELWIEPEPNAQLTLLWLLAHLGGNSGPVSNVRLRQLDEGTADLDPAQLASSTGLSRRSRPITSTWPALRGGPMARRRRKHGSICSRGI